MNIVVLVRTGLLPKGVFNGNSVELFANVDEAVSAMSGEVFAAVDDGAVIVDESVNSGQLRTMTVRHPENDAGFRWEVFE